MKGQRMQTWLLILFLLLGTSTAWSQRHRKPETGTSAEMAPDESKINPRFAHKSPHSYILEDGDHYAHGKQHNGGGHSEEYADSEDVKSEKEDEEAQGDENSDKTVKKDEYNDHAEKADHHDFKAGGLAFDKHLKDHKADNKEIENVKQHDVGAKFGGEAVKEHKTGKHKEKSKGHKLHGFKNVYHKEEYGDHKTFHDEFLDTDHLHNYDDHHEHKEMQGGKFSKGFKHEGKNKKYDKGDEKHEWGKADFDGQHEGKREKGGQSSKHRHTAKKHQGHYHADAHRDKNSVRKTKKGSPPVHIPHSGHHGPHKAQLQPMYYGSHNPHNHQEEVHVPPAHYKPQVHQSHHETQFDDDQDSYGNHHSHISDDDMPKEIEHIDHGGHRQIGDEHDDRYHSKDSSEEHDSEYEERTAHKPQHRLIANERVPEIKEDKILHKQEPDIQKQSLPVSHRPPQNRQPLVYVERYKQPEYSRQDRISHPFNDNFERRNHRIHYGHQQPRNHHHHHHHHHNQQQQHNQRQHHFPRYPVFDHNHHHRMHHRPKQHPFPRFSSFDNRHQPLGYHSHKPHFRHLPSIYKQDEPKPIALAQAQPTNIESVQDAVHSNIPKKQYE